MADRYNGFHRKECQTCKYRASPFAVNNCNYIIVMRERRGCPPENCTRYEKGKRIKPKSKEEWWS